MTAEQEREAVIVLLRERAVAWEVKAHVAFNDGKVEKYALAKALARGVGSAADAIERGDHHLSRNPDNPRK